MGSIAAGGVTHSNCPYQCISDKYKTPKCYTPFEDLIYTFGGPWPFAFLLFCVVMLLALILNTLRIKFIGSGCSYDGANSIMHHDDQRSPYLLSLSEVRKSLLCSSSSPIICGKKVPTLPSLTTAMHVQFIRVASFCYPGSWCQGRGNSGSCT